MIEGGALLLEKMEAYLAKQRYEDAFEVTKVRQVDTYVRTTAHPYMATSLRFNRRKSSNTYRIFCLGGSAAMGWPHPLALSYPSFLQQKLNYTAPYHNFEVINAAASTYSSHQVRKIFDEILQYQPDLIILYSGNNEFLHHYARQMDQSDFPLATGRVLMRGWKFITQRGFEPQLSASFLLDRALGSDVQQKISETGKKAMQTAYRENLHYMQQQAKEAGISLLLMTLPANLRDWRPHASRLGLFHDSVSLRNLQQYYVDAKSAMQARKYHQAITHFRKALSLDSGHAALQFELGKAFLKNQQPASARPHFTHALNLDAYPLRAVPAMNDYIRSLAEDTATWLMDLEKMLANRTDDGLIGDQFLADHVHPTVKTNEFIAEGVLKALHHQGIIRLPKRALPQLAPERTAFLTPTYLRNLFLIYRVMHQFDKVSGLHRECCELAKNDQSYVPLLEELESYLKVAAPFQALQEARSLKLEDSLYTITQIQRIEERYARANQQLLKDILPAEFVHLTLETQVNQ